MIYLLGNNVDGANQKHAMHHAKLLQISMPTCKDLSSLEEEGE
jgi:hypothetical protein